MYKHILVATDGSKASSLAVRCGASLSRALHARLTVLTVTHPLITFADHAPNVESTLQEYRSYMKGLAAKILAEAAAQAASVEVDCERVHIEDRYTSEAILNCAAERGCDLIVMGSKGRRGLERLLIGSETQRVLAASSIPVLVAPPNQAGAECPEGAQANQHSERAAPAD